MRSCAAPASHFESRLRLDRHIDQSSRRGERLTRSHARSAIQFVPNGMACGRASIKASLAGPAADCGTGIFESLTSDSDNRCLMVDTILLCAHHHAATVKGGPKSCPGRSRGGLTTQIHALADALEHPLRFILKSGEAGDVTMFPALLVNAQAYGAIADKACDSGDMRARIAHAGAEAAIPSSRTRKILISNDTAANKPSNKIDRFFNKI